MDLSNDKYKDLLQGYKEAVDISSIVTKTDLKGRITYANDKFCEISGYSKDELIGQPHNIVRHPKQDSEAFKDMWETIQAKKTWQGIIKNKHKNGTSYYVHATVVPFLDKNNEIVEYISIRHDITELHNLTEHLEDRVAYEVEKNRKKDIEQIANLNIFLDSIPNPIIVVSEDNIEFVNKAFLNLVSKSRGDLTANTCNLCEFLVTGKDYIDKEEDFVLNKENKVAIQTRHGENIFNLYYEEFQSFNGRPLKMYTLNNITKTEYQKLKISYYNEQLQEYYLRSKKSRKGFIEKENERPEDFETLDTDSHKQVRELSDEERTLLKRVHSDLAVSSKDYTEEINEYTLLEINELTELEDDINELIDQLHAKDEDALHEVALRLLKFSSVLNNLHEFKELAFSISSLANLLDKQKMSELDETIHKKMILFLENIILDLSSWRRIVFIEQSANDIHYMDSSLFSSILQLELIFNEDTKNEDEDDFELF
ncbi:PAS domain-containing protein [Sulfurimonas sp.]|uniref:PAS domain-containing protein n=1 Tax=Sulfurimonas sp. TaxID=2022749 RepID=UPI003565B42A